MNVSGMAVSDFVTLCRQRGLHFTATWVARSVRMFDPVSRQPAQESVVPERYRQHPAPCQAFQSHPICIMVCEKCLHPYEAHVKKEPAA